jgi:type IX secretion system PorP/SprF family membrane protein
MKRIAVIGFLLFALTLQGQDLHLTQFYASPLYLNPALTGANAASRVSTSYRNQWGALPGSFNSFLVSFDHYIHEMRSGVGIILLKDAAGSMRLGTTSLGFTYAFDYKITHNWSAAIGIKAGYSARSLDHSRLVFGDQLVRDAETSVQLPFLEKVSYFDFTSGVVFFNKETWFGFSVNHMNKPIESFLPKTAYLPGTVSLHGGKNIYMEKGGSGRVSLKPYFMLAANYRYQAEFDQFDIGLYLKQPQYFTGIWYRGIPVFKRYAPGYPNNDAIAILLGGVYKQGTLSYSYDFTISQLSGRTGGSHEISATYYMSNPRKSKKVKKKVMPCTDMFSQ